MENYTSDSSDSDNANKIIDLNYLMLDTETMQLNLESLSENGSKSTKEIDCLTLAHNRLTTLPQNIFKFSNLKTLDVSANGLTVLPDVFKYCQLQVLIAKNNDLRNDSLPKCFTVNPTVREINFSGNTLTQFPEQLIDFHSLKYLYLGGNRITNISRNISKLCNIFVLSMGGNLLTEVPQSVGQLKSLQALVLSDNQIESLPADIAKLKNLKSLLLHKNKLKTLPQEIVTLKNLTELSLRDNPLVVRFVSDMTHNPATLLELSARSVKINNVPVLEGDIPNTLVGYLTSANSCVNPKCKGVFFDSRVEHIKFVDFCGKYRIPLLQYLCSSKCIASRTEHVPHGRSSYMMRKVLLG